MCKKYLSESDILSKDVGQWLASSLKMLLIHRYFSYVFLMQSNCTWFDEFNNIEQGRANRKFTTLVQGKFIKLNNVETK